MSVRDSPIGILQDPLLMLLALMLFASVGLILPTSGPDVQSQDVAELEAVLEELITENADLQRDAALPREGGAPEAPQVPASLEERLAQLEERIRDVRERLEEARLQRDALQSELDGLGAPQPDWPDDAAVTDDELVTEAKLEQLRRRRDELKAFVKPTGVPEYVSVGNRMPVYFEARNGRVYPVRLGETYEVVVDSFEGNYARPRPNAPSYLESEVLNPSSGFQRHLARIDPERQYVQFMVFDSGFEVFLSARLEAQRNPGGRLMVGWAPVGEGPVRVSSGVGTNPRHKATP